MTPPRTRARRDDVEGIELHACAGIGVVDDPAAVTTQAGKPYSVFTPFSRRWLKEPRRDVLKAPTKLPPLPSRLAKGRIPSLAALGLEQEVAEPAKGGEEAGRKRLDAFFRTQIDAQAGAREDPGADSTSRLSPYLHFGCVSPLALERRAAERNGKGPEAFRRQLAWRDFYLQLIHHFPANAQLEFKHRYRDRPIKWSRSKKDFEAWCAGETGYPFVDAGMRQLRQEGFMHNRARLVVGSFLTKHLGIDWRWGESHFMRLLLDGDEASNNGNWQWIASVGSDPAPYYRRIFNPARQQERFDPSGAYVRAYVPELRGVPDKYLPEPWTMPEEVQSEAGCVIGHDYPGPIVDHARAREQALERYRATADPAKARSRSGSRSGSDSG